ncbi:MAG: fumarylacetoacetate hydrolase family protein [Pirellulaceae bacterium]
MPDRVLPLDDLASMAGEKYLADVVHLGELERLFPINSAAWMAIVDLLKEIQQESQWMRTAALPRDEVTLLPPIARPPKLLMLAGNYAAHIEEQGGVAKERAQTFPYVFMKPATTTLIGDRALVQLPAISPNKIDHEVELAVVIGREARHVKAEDALDYVAGYTIINDISDRGFHPNVNRETRPKDQFFDWLHGKWHDGFCPCGPCLVTSDEISDPQSLKIALSVDGEVRQSGSTAEQVFSVAEIIAFISSWMTLEPGDIISTGTPAGVGNATGKYLRAGQTMIATIQSIGQLHNTIV